MKRWLACISGIVLAAALASAGEAPNLAANPGFEEVEAGSSLPAQWRGSDQVYMRDITVARSGNASLKFQNADAGRYVLCTQPIELEAGARYELSAWVKTENIVGNESGATLCIEYKDAEGKYLGGAYPSGVTGTRDWTLVQGLTPRIPEDKAGSCSLACYVRKGMTGTAWWDDISVRRFREAPLSAVLKSPNYRDEITRGGPRDVLVFVELNLQDYELEPEDVAVHYAVYPENGDSPLLSGQMPPLTATTFDIPLRARKFKPGVNRVEVVLLEKSSDEALATETLHVTRNDERVTRAVDIDEHKRVLVDGRPFFPLGMYWSGIDQEQLDVYADSAFNCLMPYGMPTQEQMDMVQAKGLKVIYSVKDIYHGSSYCPKAITSREDETAFIQGKVEAFRDHPALLAWYINDEMPSSMLDRLTERKVLLEQLDPDHPTWVVLYQVDELRRYLPSFHVIGTDPYPIPTRPVALAGQWTRKTVDGVHGARPVWMVPQVFNWANYKKTADEKAQHRAPTLEEMRSMAWQCIAEGANGLVFYSWFDLRKDPTTPFEEQWARVKQVASGIAPLAPVLLSVEEVPAIETSEAPWLNWTAKKYERIVYLIAVNNEPEKHVATFNLSRKIRKATDVPTREEWPLPDRRVLELQFEPYEVHIVALHGMERAWNVGFTLNLDLTL